MRRAALLLVLMGGLVVALATPASAHGAGGVEATNYLASVDRFVPPLVGVRLRVLAASQQLELRNDGPEVVVLSPQGQPLLRVGPDGAFENQSGPVATHELGVTPSGPDPTAPPPDWKKVADRPIVRWHDHRLHWTGDDPPQVKAHPAERQEVQPPSSVVVRRDAVTATATVRLTWVPGSSPGPWLGVAAAAFVGIAALGLLRRWSAPLSATAGALLVADLLHAGATAFAAPGGVGRHLIRMVAGDFYAIVGWVLAVIALRLLARSKVDGLYAGVFAGLSIALFGGLLDVAVLARSVTPSTLPLAAVRLCIALALGGGTGLAAACLLVIRRTPGARLVPGAIEATHGPAPEAAG